MYRNVCPLQKTLAAVICRTSSHVNAVLPTITTESYGVVILLQQSVHKFLQRSSVFVELRWVVKIMRTAWRRELFKSYAWRGGTSCLNHAHGVAT